MSAARNAAVERALDAGRVLVVCGSGGVGKTTTAAALALAAAARGRAALVCTIDPSRRLATSLGLRQLSSRPRRLPIARAVPAARGKLWAMTLDTRRTFDALVERHAPDPATRKRILENSFYREVSSALQGSHEYMAMEKLLELASDPRFDLVVLDTPPTRHALDFLEAPDRLLGFLDASVLRFFLRPYFVAGRLTLRVASRTGAAALRLADRYLGLGFLEQLSEFFLSFEGMYDGFKQRAAQVHALLRSEGSNFVLVTSASPSALAEARYFHARLVERRMPFAALIVNRLHAPPRARRAGRAPAGPGVALDAELRRRLVEICREQQALADAERRSVNALSVDLGVPVARVPELESDVHDLRGLNEVARALLA